MKVAVLNVIIRGGLREDMRFKQTLEEGEEVSPMFFWVRLLQREPIREDHASTFGHG